MTITQVITELPDAPERSSPSTFSDKADEFLGALPDMTTEENTWATQANALAVTVNADAVSAASSESAALSAANFSGNYSGLTGALNVPASVYHLAKYWMLLSDLTDVTAKVPGTDVEWVEITSFSDTLVKTTAYTVMAADCRGILTISSAGASADITHTLPTGTEGFEISFYVAESYYVTVEAANSEKIRFVDKLSIANGGARSDVQGTHFTFKFIDGEWQVIEYNNYLELETT